MITGRKPFQGVFNIVRFNWHFYVLATLFISGLIILHFFVPYNIGAAIILLATAISLSIFISLATSYYVYDLSNLYTLNWLNHLKIKSDAKLVNINAGFDETSKMLAQKYPTAQLTVFDFYDPAKHTEVSIERARKAYPAYPGTQTIQTNRVPLEHNSTDAIFLIFAVHEIRNDDEQIIFLKKLQQSLSSNGKIIVVEHSRDFINFIAYNIGFLHFFSKDHWRKTFQNVGLTIELEKRITQFITIYTLQKNGTSN